MIRRILSWLFGLPTLIILLLFALANRHPVLLSLDPLTPQQPWLAVELPLWMIVFAGVLLGMLIGGMAAWAKQGKWRKLARKRQQELELERMARQRLERQLLDIKAAERKAESITVQEAANAAASSPPALPGSMPPAARAAASTRAAGSGVSASSALPAPDASRQAAGGTGH